MILDRMDSLNAAELARRIADGAVSASAATEISIQRLAELHKRCNVLSCERFSAAVKEAREADERKAAGDWLGPLHGVPITIKDCFHVEGLPTALGIDGRDELASEDALLVRRLRDAGGIVLGKTTVPQGMVYLETVSPLCGRTLHPTHPDRSPGGSSGGEAVAIAGGGSSLGLGSDLGGSLRIPAHFCGICALKPTSRVLDTTGLEQPLPLALPIPTSPGPMARNVEDLALAMHILSDRVFVESTSGHGDRTDSSSIRFAVWLEDGYFPTAPPIRAAIRALAEALSEHHGYSRVEFPSIDFREVFRLELGMLSADGGDGLRRMLGNSRQDPLMRKTLQLAGLPWLIRSIGRTVAVRRRQTYLADLIAFVGRRSVDSLWQLAHDWNRWKQAFQKAWDHHGVDVLLTPALPIPAIRHGDAEHAASACGFAFLANVLDFPAGVVPMGVIPQEGAPDLESWDAPPFARSVLAKAGGLPIGVQVMGRPFQEANVLRVMRTCELLRAGSPVCGRT